MSSENIRLMSRMDTRVHKDGYTVRKHLTGPNPTPWAHYHDYYELTYYFGSEPTCYFYEGAQYDLRYGDIVLCDMFRAHQFRCDENETHERVTLGISPQLLMYFAAEDENLNQIFKVSNKQYPVLHPDFNTYGQYADILTRFLAEEGLSRGMSVQRALLHLLTARIFEDCKPRMEKNEGTAKDETIVGDILKYIDAHIKEKMTIDELAAVVNYSPATLSKIFKRVTGETIVRYVQQKRIWMAKMKIRDDMPLAKVAEECGFLNYSHFYKSFLALEGTSPQDYRMSLRK